MNPYEYENRHGMTARHGWTFLAAAILLLTGCSAGGTLSRTEAGLAGGDAERLSLIVAQTRAQFPERSALQLRQGPHRIENRDTAQTPGLALSGTGRGIRPGVQKSAPDAIRLSLYLDKGQYNAGWARIAIAENKEERWPVLAHDLRGQVDRDFELILTLADPKGRVRYLVVLGGRYPAEAPEFAAYEGTLIFPGPGARIDQWEKIYKIDFGFRHPDPPLFEEMVGQAEKSMDDLQRAVAQLNHLREKIERTNADRDAMAAKPGRSQDPELLELNLARLNEQVRDLEQRLAAQTESTEEAMAAYYGLRAELSDRYAEFAASNHYRWQNRARQQKFYDHWKKVEYHHPEIDGLHKALIAHLQDGRGTLEKTRAEAFVIIDRNNNWDKNPAKHREDRTAAARIAR